MKRLVFRAPTPREPLVKTESALVRVLPEAYNIVEKISAKTGLKKSFIASQMIMFAAENTDILYDGSDTERT